MNTTASTPTGPFTTHSQDDFFADSGVQTCISGLLSSFQSRVSRSERRSDQRYPFPYLINLTPVGADGTPSVQETIVVVGKHLSEHGLGFYHNRPLPYRRMIVSFETTGGTWVGLLIDLTWCRFTKQGWYESGGRFLQAVASPLAPKQPS